MMPWFKYFAEARHDGKLWALTDAQHRTFTHLLCYASVQSTRGVIDAVNEVVLANETTRGNVELLRETLAALTVLECVSCVTSTEDAVTDVTPSVTTPITRVTVTFLNFNKRQGSRVRVDSPEAQSSRDRVRKHRQNKKLRLEQETAAETVVTPDSSGVTSSVTSVTSSLEEDRERETEEEKTPPNPPWGGVCVSVEGSEPIPIENAPKPSPPKVDDAELNRVAEQAERLFPGQYFGGKVRGIAGIFSLATIDAGLIEMHGGETQTWKYLLGILRRIEGQGGPKKAAVPNRGPTSAAPEDTPEQKAARIAGATERMKDYMAQEGRRGSRQRLVL